MEVPLLDLEAQYQEIKDEVDEAIQGVLDSTQYIMGEDVDKVEEEIADYCDVEYALGVASGTDALLLSLHALDVGPGDEVIVPSFTFFATAGVVTRLGAKPVFADIDPDTYNITAEEIEDKVTENTKAVIPVHLYGQPCDMDKIREVAERNDLYVIEDACQAIGAKYKGEEIGNFGEAAALSFYPAKNLGCYGDGGMILTNDQNLKERCERLRVHGADPKYYHHEVGYNSRLDSIQAAVLRVKLKYLDEWNKGRRKNAKTYNRLFNEYGLTEAIKLPKKKVDKSEHVYHQYVIGLSERDKVQDYLQENDISTNIYYPLPLHMQKCYEDLETNVNELPVTEEVYEEVLALPIDPTLTEEQLEYVVKNIEEALE